LFGSRKSAHFSRVLHTATWVVFGQSGGATLGQRPNRAKLSKCWWHIDIASSELITMQLGFVFDFHRDFDACFVKFTRLYHFGGIAA